MVERKHFVYKTTNWITGEYYYGKHTGFEDDDYLGSGLNLNKDIDKLGRENFEREIVGFYNSSEEAFEAEAATVTQELVDDPMCYNMVLGGSCMGIEETPVVQFDLKGNKVRIFDTMMDALISINQPTGSLSDACNTSNLKKRNEKSRGGYQWRYYSEVGDINHIGPVKRKGNHGGNCSKRKRLLDLDTLKVYSSGAEAARTIHPNMKDRGSAQYSDEMKSRTNRLTEEEYYYLQELIKL